MALNVVKNNKQLSPHTGDPFAYGKEANVQFVDFRFVDLFGRWQHFSLPFSEFTAAACVNGFGFDGSSIVGFQNINDSDLILKPDLHTFCLDPTLQYKTLIVFCDIWDPVKKEPYLKDSRRIAKVAEKYLGQQLADARSCWGAELELYVFDNLAFGENTNESFYQIDSNEGDWNSGRREGNLGYRPRIKQGYFPTPPVDQLQDIRSGMVLALGEAGIRVETHHHEVGGAGQIEIDLAYDGLVDMADKITLAKYIIRNYCNQNNLVACFMPKPLIGDNGSGLHTHQSLWKEEIPLFYDKDGDNLLSDMARWYIGGLLKHAKAIAAFANPTINSYRRLVPNFEAPTKLAYGVRNRSACIRIPTYSDAPAARRLEFRSPDATCNPYLAYSAMLMAGIDGITNKIDPGRAFDCDLYEQNNLELDELPESLEEALAALKQDHDFLLKGDVFSDELLNVWQCTKYEQEIVPMKFRPHPYEFVLYANY